MPIVRDIPLNLQTREVLRQSGIKEDSKLKSEMETLIGQLLVSVNDEHLLEPTIVYESYLDGHWYRATDDNLDRG